jgi:large subunit ribosomal protein L25
MNEITLVAKKREAGKQISKQYRRDGLIPGVFYKKGAENINLLVGPLDLRPVVYTDVTRVINLEFEGETHKCLLKDVVFDPITDALVHFDLLGLDDNTPVTIKVPFKYTGQPVGVRAGGNFQQVLRKIGITCLPKDLIESITLDISKMKIGSTLYAKDIKIENVEFSVGDDTAICMVSRPRVVKEGALDLDDDDDDSTATEE